MALINCRSCSRPMDHAAIKCMFCGAPLPNARRYNIRLALFAALATVFLVAFFACGGPFLLFGLLRQLF